MQQALAEQLSVSRAAAMHESREKSVGRLCTISRVQCCAVCVVLLLYVAGISSHWYILPDSAVYLLLADSLAEGEGYSIAGQPHTKFPPGFPLLVAGLKSVGLGSMLALNTIMALLGLATLVVAYKLLESLTTRPVAAVITFALALTHDMYGHSHWQLSEVPFTLLVLAGLLCYLQRPSQGVAMELGTLALVASCWVRVVGMPIAVAAAFALILQHTTEHRRRATANAVACVLGVAVTAGYLYWLDQQARATIVTASYAAEADQLTGRSLAEWLSRPAYNFYATGGEIHRLFTGQETPLAIALVVLWIPIAIGMALHFRAGKYIPLMATVAYVGGILVFRPLVSRYLLPLAPMLLLYFFEGLQFIIASRPRLERVATKFAMGVVVFMACINLPKDVRLAWANHQNEQFVNYRRDWPATVAAADFLRNVAEPKQRFVSSHSWGIISYLSDVPCYQVDRKQVMKPPGADEMLTALRAEGVGMVVLEKKARRQPYFVQLAELVGNSARFRHVYENELFVIYSSDGALALGNIDQQF